MAAACGPLAPSAAAQLFTSTCPPRSRPIHNSPLAVATKDPVKEKEKTCHGFGIDLWSRKSPFQFPPPSQSLRWAVFRWNFHVGQTNMHSLKRPLLPVGVHLTGLHAACHCRSTFLTRIVLCVQGCTSLDLFQLSHCTFFPLTREYGSMTT